MRYEGYDNIYGKNKSPKSQKSTPFKFIMSVEELIEMLKRMRNIDITINYNTLLVSELLDILIKLPSDYIIGFPPNGSYLSILNPARQYVGFINLSGKFIYLWEKLDN